MLKEKLGTTKCFRTAWGKLITEEEAYTQINRQIAAFCANLFQVMRIFEPSWEKRTEAICDIANMMNMAVAGTPEEQKAFGVFGLDAVDQALDAIAAGGAYKGTIDIAPYDTGYLALETILKAIKGEEVEKTIYQPMKEVTPENISEYL